MKKIAAVVITFHLLLVFWFVLFEKIPQKLETKTLAIKHFVAKPTPKPTHKTTTASTPTPSKKPEPKTPPPPPAPSPPSKKPSQKKPPSSPAPQLKKTPAPVVQKEASTKATSTLTQKLMRELEESIAKIEGSHDKVDTSKQLKIPRTIETLKIDSIEESNPSEDYAGSLILCLRESLHLPDFGEVKIQITLRQDGSVEQITVLKTESENNRRYLETHLPHIKFPALKKPKHTFVLTFCNEV